MARKAAGKKRGPKKGYKQSASHIAKRRKALKAAWKAGKFKNRRRRKASARTKVKRIKRSGKTAYQKRELNKIKRLNRRKRVTRRK